MPTSYLQIVWQVRADPILICNQGSIAHGTFTDQTDDEDFLSVVVPDITHYYGLRKFGRQGTRVVQKDKWDVTIHEARKFVGLCAKGNPNVLSALWVNSVDIVLVTSAGQLLIDNRDLFATKRAYRAFAGYASSQLKLMERYGQYKGYMGSKRKAMVDEFGYDPKAASHLIRLLRMGIEFLDTGELIVKRPDAQELIDIKTGKWPLEDVKALGEHLFYESKMARDRSSLPDMPDSTAVNDLCVEVVTTALRSPQDHHKCANCTGDCACNQSPNTSLDLQG